jgi:LysR family glycine cleavage system transcriptional activator
MALAHPHREAYVVRHRQRKSLRTLSRLKALQAFEASARHGAFTGAAAELGVTSAAVGQMVRSLEAYVGAPLFIRRKAGGERLAITDATREAMGDLAAGFDRLESGLRRLRQANSRQIVTVTASHAIVGRWLMPRLQDFSTHCPGIDVRLDVSDRTVDVAQGEADIGVRCGPGTWPGVTATLLMKEEIFAACSPGLCPSGTANSAWLATQTLIHDETPVARGVFPTWAQWLKHAEMRVLGENEGPRINSSPSVLQAALRGQGVALVRAGLAADDLAAGRLVRLFAHVSWPIDWAYYAVVSPARLARPPVAAFHAWLLTMWGAGPA